MAKIVDGRTKRTLFARKLVDARADIGDLVRLTSVHGNVEGVGYIQEIRSPYSITLSSAPTLFGCSIYERESVVLKVLERIGLLRPVSRTMKYRFEELGDVIVDAKSSRGD